MRKWSAVQPGGPLSILMTQKEQFAPVPGHVLEALQNARLLNSDGTL
jgi:hypothetical protein